MGKHRKPDDGGPDLRDISAGKRRGEPHAPDGWTPERRSSEPDGKPLPKDVDGYSAGREGR